MQLWFFYYKIPDRKFACLNVWSGLPNLYWAIEANANDKNMNVPKNTNTIPKCIYQADILFMPEDNGYKYVLVVVDEDIKSQQGAKEKAVEICNYQLKRNVINQADFEEWTKFNKLQFHRYRTERILKMFSQVFAELKET